MKTNKLHSTSVRINKKNGQIVNSILQSVNKKKFGRKIKMDDLLEIILGKITDDDIKSLQKKSIRPDERKEMMRQKYIQVHGAISKAKFTEFMMSIDYISFLKEQINENEEM